MLYRYYKMNETTLSIGDNFKSPGYTISALNDIEWLFEYSGSWIKICPGFFEYGQNENPKSSRKATTKKRIQVTTRKLASTTRSTKPNG